VVSTLEQLTLSCFTALAYPTDFAAQISVVPEKYNRDSASFGAAYLFHFLQ
jgi:hypothetical protein